MVKRGLTIGLAIAALGITVSFVTADSSPRDPVTAADAVPAYQILTTLREMGLEPNTQPVRRGPYYVLHALDPSGLELRVVADAHFGDVISIRPARPSYAVNYHRGPRIIHVPQAGDESDGYDDRTGREDGRGGAALTGNDDDDELKDIAPSPRRAKPSGQSRSAEPPAEPRRKPYKAAPPAPRRTVLSAPPPPAEGPSPIYPTPKFDKGEKFAPPKNEAAPPPPPGYTAPAALPED